MFQGTTTLVLDEKFRLAVPTRHRKALEVAGDGKLVLTAHPHGCLLLYPDPVWVPIRERVMSFSSLERAAGDLQSLLVGFAEDVEMDKAGRILISQELREFAELGREVKFVGQGAHFKIWNSEVWRARIGGIKGSGPQQLPPGAEHIPI